MNPLALLKLLNPKVWLVLAIVAATAGALGYTYKKGGDAPRAELAGLKSLYKAEAARAAADRAEAERQDRIRKEKADAKATAARAALQRTVDELRHQRDAARGAFLSRAPAGSGCPDGQVCFDRAEYLGAYGDLVGRLRGAADECSALEADMGVAAEWARGRRGD